MTRFRSVAIFVCSLCLIVTVVSQAQAPETPKKAPTPLSDVQKLTIQNRAKDVRIADLTAQQAIANFNAAKAEFDKAFAAVQVPCFDLTDKLDYVPNPKANGCKDQ